MTGRGMGCRKGAVSMVPDPTLRIIVNGLQSGFPLAVHPFARAGAELGLSGGELLEGIGRLLEQGYASRFGPLYNAERLGGAVTLAAMAVPPERFETVAQQVNAFPQVAHNYAREHQLNMWFVVAAPEPGEVGRVLAEIERGTGLPVYDMPKREEYEIGFGVRVGSGGSDVAKLAGRPPAAPAPALDPLDHRLVEATQEGLPLLPEPYREVASRLGLEEGEVLARLSRLLEGGVIRRLGVIPNHYRLGLRANGMSVWQVPEASIGRLGRRVGALGYVTHCYHRPPHPPQWPYNLFAMVHGPDRLTVRQRVEEIRTLLGEECGGHEVLFSSRILKKTGLRVGGGAA